MTDEPKTTRTVEQLDLNKPIWWTFYQTPSSRIFEPFVGKDAEKKAKERAQERSASLNRTVVVIPPQRMICKPVVEKVTVQEIEFE